MIPIDSHQEARLVSYVALVDSTSPLLTFTRQFLGVPVIATSQDTAPAGSKYFALDRKRGTVLPFRRSLRSVCSPPGWRWPAVATSTPGLSITTWFRFGPPPYGFFASFGYVNRPLRPEPFFTLKTGYCLPASTSIQIGCTGLIPRAAAEPFGAKSTW